MTATKRLTLFDCIGIGINGIVGSGIFFVPKWVAGGAGAWGPLAFLACGLMCALVALSYAEVGGMFDRSGGTYLYAKEAFGDAVGFGVGWLVLVSAVLGYAAVSRALGDEVARAFALPEWSGRVFSAGLILLLGITNFLGVKTGARFSDLLTIAKVLPLLLFVGVGLFFIDWSRFHALGAPASVSHFAEGTFSALFALSGFEFVAVVAGETENPRRNIPLAILGSLLGATVVYALIQLVATGVLPGLTSSEAPLVEAAQAFAGSWGGMAIRVGAIISMIGFCSGSALVGPQLFAALSREGVLPAAVATRHGRFQTPHVAILLVTGFGLLGTLALDFKQLADLTIITLFTQYVPTTLSVLVFRKKRPEAKRLFRIPLGPVIPLLALAAMAPLILKIELKSLAMTGVIMGVGLAVYVVHRMVARPSTGAVGPQP